MYSLQFIIGLVLIGILSYAAVLHGLVYCRMRSFKVDGIFALLCLSIAAYAGTNVLALFMITDVADYVLVSKISTMYVMFAVFLMAWFASEYLGDRKNIPLKLILFALAPFFAINLFMPNGMLWTSIEGIALTERPWGKPVMRPVGAVISWPMYAFWAVLASVYLLILRAAYLTYRHAQQTKGAAILWGFVVLTIGLVFDALIDIGLNKEYFYVSEYLIIFLVVLMSLHLTNELRQHALNLETIVDNRTEQLQQANTELESFSHSISHDLHAPLRAMQGFASALNEEAGDRLNDEQNDYLQRIMSNTKRMDEMLDAMLYISKVTRSELVSSEVNISALAAEVVHELQQAHPDRQLSITIEDNIVVQGDQVLLRIVLENLLRNAWKYTTNTDHPQISIRRHICQDGRNGFVVMDNGVGFDKQYSEKLFIMFQRFHSTSDYPGLGIGLATVASIVKRHGGKVWAEGHEGQGASFYICL